VRWKKRNNDFGLRFTQVCENPFNDIIDDQKAEAELVDPHLRHEATGFQIMSIFILVGGLMGAAGVALSAYGAHAGGGNVTTAAQFLLFHAPLFVALGLAENPNRVRTAGAGLLAIGLALFCGDLLVRHFAGTRLFAMAAPAGGMAMISGWLVIAISELRRKSR
tara:strand:- start:4491 stop:4982 length:492 start_codon:yes stop_codon:yes gene_type:complete